MVDDTFKLENRLEGMGPVFVGSYQLGDVIEQWSIEPGNQVALKCDGVTVITDVTEVLDHAYKGVIIGFEHFYEEGLHGKKAGDEISFNYINIIGCSR